MTRQFATPSPCDTCEKQSHNGDCIMRIQGLPYIHPYDGVVPEVPRRNTGEPMRPITGTIYFCLECGRVFEGSGDVLPCGHSRYVYYSPHGLRDVVLVNREAIKQWRAGEMLDAPQCLAVKRKIVAFFRVMSLPDNCLDHSCEPVA